MSLPKYTFEPLPTLRLPLDTYHGSTQCFRSCETSWSLQLPTRGDGRYLGTHLGVLAAPSDVTVTSTSPIAACSSTNAHTPAADGSTHSVSAKLMAAASSGSCQRERSQQTRIFGAKSGWSSRSVLRAATAAHPKLCPSTSSPVHADPAFANQHSRNTSKTPDPRVSNRLYEMRKPGGPAASTEVDGGARLADLWNRSSRGINRDAEPVVRSVSPEASASKSANRHQLQTHGSQPPETRRAPQRGSGDVAIHSVAPSHSGSASCVGNTTNLTGHRHAAVVPERPSSAPKRLKTKGVLLSTAVGASKERCTAPARTASCTIAEGLPSETGQMEQNSQPQRHSVTNAVEERPALEIDTSDAAAGFLSAPTFVDPNSSSARWMQEAGVEMVSCKVPDHPSSTFFSGEPPLRCADIVVAPPPVSSNDVVRGQSHSSVETDTSISMGDSQRTVSGMPLSTDLDSRLGRPPLFHKALTPQSDGAPRVNDAGGNRSLSYRYLGRDVVTSSPLPDADMRRSSSGLGRPEGVLQNSQAQNRLPIPSEGGLSEPCSELGWLHTHGDSSGGPVKVVAVGAVSRSVPFHGGFPVVGSFRDAHLGITSLSAPASTPTALRALPRPDASATSHAHVGTFAALQDIPVYLVIPQRRPGSSASSLLTEGPALVGPPQLSTRSSSTGTGPTSRWGSSIVAYKAIHRSVTMGLLRRAFDKWGDFVVTRASAASRGAPNPHGLRSPADPQQVTQCLRLAQRSTEAVRLERLRIDAERLLLSGAFVHWRVIAQSHPSRRHVAEETTRSASSVLPSAASVKSTGGSSWQSRRHRLASAGSRASQPSTEGSGAVDGQGTPSPLRSRGPAWLDRDPRTRGPFPDTPERHAERVDVDEQRTQPPLSPQSHRLGPFHAPGTSLLGDYHAVTDSPSPSLCDWSSPRHGSSYTNTLPDRESSAVRTALDPEGTWEGQTAWGWWRSP